MVVLLMAAVAVVGFVYIRRLAQRETLSAQRELTTALTKLAVSETETNILRRQVVDYSNQLTELSLAHSAQISELSKLVAKPPVIVPAPPAPDIALIAKELGEAIAKNLNPPVTHYLPPPDPRASEVGVVAEQRRWVPDTDLDDWMNDGPYPTQGGWVIPGTPAANMFKDVITDENGVRRADGTPMFLPGSGSPPPVGGTE